MTTRQSLEQVLDELPDESLLDVLRFASSLSLHQEAEAWQRFGLRELSRCYGPDEPVYTDADIKSELNHEAR